MVTLEPNKIYWIREDGVVFVEDPEGEEYLIVDRIGETLRLKEIGKLER